MLQNTALIFIASSPQHLKLTSMLLEAGVSVNATNKRSQTPLIAAVGSNKVDFLRLVSSVGAFMNFTGEFGRTMLGTAVAFGRLECVRLLRDSGADVDAHSPGEITPLPITSKHQHPQTIEITRLLVKPYLRRCGISHIMEQTKLKSDSP